jgi:hypothetical protein
MIKFIIFLFISSLYSLDLEQKLNGLEIQQKAIDSNGIGGYVIHRRMPLIPPEELFKDVPKIELQPLPLINPSTNFGYVSYSDYHKEVIELNNKINSLENSLVRLADVTAKVQTTTVKNGDFILKLIEIILAAVFGGGGLLKLIVYFRNKKDT